MSAMSALDKIEAKAKKVAAHVMEAAEADIEFKDGTFSVKGTDKKMAFGEVALAAYVAHKFPTSEVEPGLKEGAFYDPTNFTFPAGTHVCELEVDIDTGVVEIIDWIAVDDFGTGHQPDDRGRPGAWRYRARASAGMDEGAVYDESGQLLTGSYMDYTMPRADMVPSFKLGLHRDQEPVQPARRKGLWRGRCHCGSPAAFMNAVTNALDVKHVDMPATPQRIWAASAHLREAAE
jgi:carbon-monoxide dehydrogenase large subunit